MADGKRMAEEGAAKLRLDDIEQGVSFLGDPWELVGSPRSFSAETTPDELASEAAAGAACSSGALSYDCSFSYRFNLSTLNGLPLSTAMAQVHSEEEACSSISSDATVPVDPYGEAVENLTGLNDHNGTFNLSVSGILMHNDNDGLHENAQLADSMCHDVDSSFYMLLEDDIKDLQSVNCDDAGPDRCNCVVANYDSISLAVNDLHKHANESLDEDSMIPIVPTIHNAGYMMGTGHNAQQLSTFASFEGSESSDVSLAVQDGSAAACCSSSEDVSSRGIGRLISAKVENSLDLHDSVINYSKTRQFKIRACTFWLWNQFRPWKAQFGYANTVWSLAFAMALMGILALRRRLQQLHAQNSLLRSKVWAMEKRITQLMFQLIQAKDASTRIRRVPVICVKSS